MSDTAQNLTETVLRNLGNLSIAVYGQHALDAVNAAYLERAQGRSYRDFRELQRTATFSVLTSSGISEEGTQVLAFSNWANDIWVPVSWRDRTHNEKLIPVSINDLDEIEDLSASPQIDQYAIWGNSLVISPAVSETTVIAIRYISTAAKFTWVEDTKTVTGTSVLPDMEDIGIILLACERLAAVVNPALVSIWASQFAGWNRRRISPVDAEILEESSLTAFVDSGNCGGEIF